MDGVGGGTGGTTGDGLPADAVPLVDVDAGVVVGAVERPVEANRSAGEGRGGETGRRGGRADGGKVKLGVAAVGSANEGGGWDNRRYRWRRFCGDCSSMWYCCPATMVPAGMMMLVEVPLEAAPGAPELGGIENVVALVVGDAEFHEIGGGAVAHGIPGDGDGLGGGAELQGVDAGSADLRGGGILISGEVEGDIAGAIMGGDYLHVIGAIEGSCHPWPTGWRNRFGCRICCCCRCAGRAALRLIRRAGRRWRN